MNRASANINLMIKAARFAAKRLLRDFGEVENLQVSQKSPSDFVTRADRKAEERLKLINEAYTTLKQILS